MEKSWSRDSGVTGIIINYYNPLQNGALYYQTLFCASSYLENNNCIVCISDGSGFFNEQLAKEAESLKIIYVYSHTKLGFSQGYNQGINYFRDIDEVTYLILSANDIIATKDCVQKMVGCFNQKQNAGCVIPYLSHSDYFIQGSKYKFRTRLVPVMTINCNLFSKKDLLGIDMVPEYLSGYFNDTVMSSKLFAKGKKIYLVKDVLLSHLVSKTILVSSTAKYESDKKIFEERHKELLFKTGFRVRGDKFSENRMEIFFSFMRGLSTFNWYQNCLNTAYRLIFDMEVFFYALAVKIFPVSLNKKLKKIIGLQ